MRTGHEARGRGTEPAPYSWQVAAGHLSFETPAREVFSWWTRDPTDQRFGVTLRHLLTFSSGMVSEEDPGAAGIACLAFPAGVLYTPQSCAKQIFETGPWRHPPGVAWSYHSLHLQLAGAMACEATGLPMKEMLETYLLHKLGMCGLKSPRGAGPNVARPRSWSWERAPRPLGSSHRPALTRIRRDTSGPRCPRSLALGAIRPDRAALWYPRVSSGLPSACPLPLVCPRAGRARPRTALRLASAQASLVLAGLPEPAPRRSDGLDGRRLRRAAAWRARLLGREQVHRRRT